MTPVSAAELRNVTITIGQQGNDTQLGFLASGLFDNLPYSVKWATFQAPTATLTALGAGHIDLANGLSQWTAIQGASAATPAWTPETAPYKTVLVTGPDPSVQLDRFVAVASRESKLTDIRQSKGKRWGFIPGAAPNLFAWTVLDKLGWTKDDVQIVTLDSTNQNLALETGRIDVSFTVTDNVPAAVQRGARILGTAHDFGLTLYTGFVANVAALNDPAKGQALGDIVRRLTLFENWLALHPAEQQAALVRGSHLSAQQAASVWKHTRLIPQPPANITASSQTLIDFAVRTGLLKQRVDASALLDNRFADVIEDAFAQSHLMEHLKESYK